MLGPHNLHSKWHGLDYVVQMQFMMSTPRHSIEKRCRTAADWL